MFLFRGEKNKLSLFVTGLYAQYEATCRYFSRRCPQLEIPHHTDHSSLLAEVENEIDTLSWPVLLFAGALAGVNGWLATFPFDVVKTRVQSIDWLREDGASHPYRNTFSTFVNSYRSDGLKVFFRGLNPTIIR